MCYHTTLPYSIIASSPFPVYVVISMEAEQSSYQAPIINFPVCQEALGIVAHSTDVFWALPSG